MVTIEYTCIINVKEHLKSSEFWELTSADLPGFYLGGKDLSALRSDIPTAIKLLFEKNYDIQVDVRLNIEPIALTQRSSDSPCVASPRSFTAIPLADAA